jgi:thiol-disulfide isomerase/thioredoxin
MLLRRKMTRLGLRAWSLAGLFAVVAVAPALSFSQDARAQQVDARPWLGVAMDAADGQSPGIRIGHVVRTSPADKAGIRDGDRIVRVASTHVSRGADVVRAVSSLSVGDAVEIAFVHAGKEQSARVTLAAFPAPDDMLRMDLVGASARELKNTQGVSGSFPASVAAMRGHVVLLDFWATWCMPCRVVIPKLGDLQSRFGAQGLNVVGLSTEDAQDVATFAQRIGMRYAVGVDKNAETTRSYGVASLPTLVVIDKRGVVRDVSVGYDPSEDARLENTVKTLLAEAAPTN